jgi:hypothetical protein
MCSPHAAKGSLSRLKVLKEQPVPQGRLVLHLLLQN